MTTVKTIEINGAEGGGQILRAALSMSAALGIPFHIPEYTGEAGEGGARASASLIRPCRCRDLRSGGDGGQNEFD